MSAKQKCKICGKRRIMLNDRKPSRYIEKIGKLYEHNEVWIVLNIRFSLTAGGDKICFGCFENILPFMVKNDKLIKRLTQATGE